MSKEMVFSKWNAKPIYSSTYSVQQQDVILLMTLIYSR